MKLDPKVFWRLTPAQFIAISERHDNAVKLENFRVGIVASVIMNRHRGRKERTYKPEDFMPQYGGRKASSKTGPQLLNYWKHLVVPSFGSKNGSSS